MDAVVREPALHRTRRIAHLPWGVRESSRECTQATEAYCEVLWLRSAIHLLFSHDCEPRRAGFSAYRERSRSCRRERGTGGREAFRVLQPANGEPKSRDSAQLHQRSHTSRKRDPWPEAADDCVRK